MGKSQLLVIDTTDDRRELRRMLTLLSPKERVAFLQWCCLQAPQGAGRLPVPYIQQMSATIDQAYRCDRADMRLSNEVYADILQAINAFDVDAVKITLELERWLKQRPHRKAAIAALATSPVSPRRA